MKIAFIAVMIGAAALSACAGHPAPPVVTARPVVLPLPQRPALPAVPASAVQCLSDSAYSALVERERALRNWGMALQAVIRENNQSAQDPPSPAKGEQKNNGG